MKTVLRISMVLALLVAVGQAQVINNFDAAPADTNYWEWYAPVTEGGNAGNPAGHYAISTSADPTLGWIHTSFVTDIVAEGDAAMRIDYSVHNSESWGGYSKLHHYYPDTLSSATYDWSLYDSLSFSYYNIVPQSIAGRVHVRLNLMDYGAVTEPAYHGLGEYLYSFEYILDETPGWHTVEMPLVVTNSFGADGWTYTGWSGDAGNGELDKSRIKGFAYEFSVSGAGEGDVVTGSIILDDMKLTGSKNVLDNGGLESADAQDDAFGWGAAHAGAGQAHANIVADAAVARNGEKYAELGIENGAAWAVFYTEVAYPAAQGETWELGGYIKNISETFTEGAFGGYKIEAKDGGGNIILSTGDVLFETTTDYELYTTEMVMPEGTASVGAVMVATRWDGSNVNYAFDDLYFINWGALDTEGPVEVTNISAIPGTNYNLVTWEDVPNEEGETYTVYASQFPITDLTWGGVDVIASGHLEGAPSVVHYLYAPLTNTSVEYYYAVTCTDAAQNTGNPGFSTTSFTNTALGIPTISLDPPSNFAADGSLDEWSGVVPFVMGDPNSWGLTSIWQTVDGNNDCSAELYLAVDDNFLYMAAEVVDDVFNGYVGDGNWWDMDAFQIFIGLYNQRGARHNALQRGAQPDYGLVFTNDYVRRDNGDMFHLGENGDGAYYFEGFNPDYVIEAKISLDSLAFGNGYTDARFHPTNGMRIIMEPIIHDNDGAWQGNVQSSTANADNAWQTPKVWSSSFVGDMDAVSVDPVEMPGVYRLSNNYPNPFNPSTMISYEIGQSEQVRLSIYNILGQEVMVLVNDVQEAGIHNVQFQAGSLASGIYMYRLEAGNFTSTNKMILMK